MPRKLLMLWGFFDFLHLGAAITAIVFTVYWKSRNGVISHDSNISTVRTLLIDDAQLIAGLALGILILISWASSILALIYGLRKGVSKLTALKLFNYILILVMVATLVIGSSIWFITLRERHMFESIWGSQSESTKELIQDTFHCCGYFNATQQGLFSVVDGYCANMANSTTVTPCVTPLTSLADTTYNDIFTVIYGFGGIQMCLFLLTSCLINVRHEEERFRKISEKRGAPFI